MLAAVSSLMFMASCSGSSSSNRKRKPAISSIKPTRGITGTIVTIKGSHFSAAPKDNIVKFGSAKAIVNSASKSRLSVAAPGGLEPGKEYDVTETVNGKTAKAPQKFTVIGKNIPPSDTAGSVPKDGVLEAVTWNIELYDASPKQTKKTKNIIKMLDSLNADLYAVEEVLHKSALQTLVSRMKGYKGIFEKTENQGDAFIYNTNAIDPISSGKITTFQQKYPWAERLPFYFSFNYEPGQGKAPIKIYAVVIHAKCCGDKKSYLRRKTAAQELYKYLTQKKPKADIILLGDFNDRLTTSIYTGHISPYQPFVQDSTNYDPLTLILAKEGKTSDADPRYPHSMIDNIIISNEMVKYYKSGSVHVVIPSNSFIGNYYNTTSDHYPVEAAFDMIK